MNSDVRGDFPVDWEDDHFVTRREFFKFLTLASGGLAVGTSAMALYSMVPKSAIRFEPAMICRMDEIEAGSARAFGYPRSNDLCLLIRRQNGELVGFTRRCTHLSCPVEYEVVSSSERLYCPCHNGVFSLDDGHVVTGPPPHPLPRVALEIRGEDIWAVGVISEASA